VDSAAANCFHALNEEDSCKATPRNLVGNIALVVFDSDAAELFGQVGIAKVSPLKLGFENAFYLRLPG
jgi:hypothetical protein